MSTLYFAGEVLPLMQSQEWGRLTTITWVAVKQPIEGLILSNAVRSDVSGLVKSMANEYGKDNVLVNNVCPGYTLTARLDDISTKLHHHQPLAVGERSKFTRRTSHVAHRGNGRRSGRWRASSSGWPARPSATVYYAVTLIPRRKKARVGK